MTPRRIPETGGDGVPPIRTTTIRVPGGVDLTATDDVRVDWLAFENGDWGSIHIPTVESGQVTIWGGRAEVENFLQALLYISRATKPRYT